MPPPHPKSKKFAALSPTERTARIQSGILSGRMTPEQGRKATAFWADHKPTGLGSGLGIKSPVKVKPPKVDEKKRAQAIKHFLVPPRPLATLAKNPQYADFFKGREDVLRQAGKDEKLTASQLMKKYGSFQAASVARQQATEVRRIERKLAQGQAEEDWASEQTKTWDVGGRVLQAGVGALPFVPDNWMHNLKQFTAGAVPGTLQLGTDVAYDIGVYPFVSLAHGGDPNIHSKTSDLAVQIGKQYAKQYGKGVTADPRTWHEIAKNWKENYGENPLFAVLDALALVNPAARLAGVGKMAAFGKIAKLDEAGEATGDLERLGVRRSIGESFRPGKHGYITRDLETRAGTKVPAPINRSPIGRGIQRATDAASRLHPDAPIIGMHRRAARLHGKKFIKQDLKRAALEATEQFQTVLDFTGGGDTPLATALFHAAQGPEGGDPMAMIEAVLADLRTMRDNPEVWKLPEKADTPALQRIDRQIEKLQTQYDKALQNNGVGARDRSMVADRTQILSARGKLQMARQQHAAMPDGPEKDAAQAGVDALRVDLENKQAALAQKATGTWKAVSGSPERGLLTQAINDLGIDKDFIKPYDMMARRYDPSDPTRWYRERLQFTGLEDAKEMLLSLNQSRSMFHIPDFHLRATYILRAMPDQGSKLSIQQWRHILEGAGVKSPEKVALAALAKDLDAEGVKSLTPEEMAKKVEEYAETPDETIIEGEKYPEYTLGGDRSKPRTFLWHLDPDLHGIRHEQLTAHFGDTVPFNVVAWVRTNIRTTKDGKRILMIEEFQSDWLASSRAKKAAWADLQRTSETLAALTAKWERLSALAPRSPANMSERERFLYGTPAMKAADAAEKEMRLAAKDYTSAKRAWDKDQATQTGPYMEADQYITLAIDRMMKVAAEEGLDGIGWTTGQQQRARWNKAAHQQVETVTWKPASEELHVVGRNSVSPTIHPGVTHFRDLKAVMGEVQAKRFWDRHLADPDAENISFPGEGIEVGAKIHDFIYDDVAPRVIAEAGKTIDQKVGKAGVEGDADYSPMAIRNAYEEATGDDFPIVMDQDMFGQWVLMDNRFGGGPDGQSTQYWEGWHGGQEPMIAGETTMARRYLEDQTQEFYNVVARGDTGWSDETVAKMKDILRKGDPHAATTEVVHFLPTPKKTHAEIRKQRFTYFRHQVPGEDLPRGATEFLADKTTRLRLSNMANEETLTHELWHIGWHDLGEADKQVLAARRGKKSFNELTRDDHEILAQEWVDWFKSGKAPSKDLDAVFTKFRNWVRQIYGALKALDDIDPEVERIYHEMMGIEGVDLTSDLYGGATLTESERLGVLLRGKKEERERVVAAQESGRKAQELPALEKRVEKELLRAAEAKEAGDVVSQSEHLNEARNLAYRISREKYQTQKVQDRRVGLLEEQITDLTDVLEQAGKGEIDMDQFEMAITALEWLMDNREEMIGVAIPKSIPIMEGRNNLVVDHLVEGGHLPEGANPSRVMLPHKGRMYWKTMAQNMSKAVTGRGISKRHTTVGAPSKTELNLHHQNLLHRWQSGDLLTDPAVAFDAHQSALAYYQSWLQRKSLFSEGDPVSINAHETGELNSGWYLVKDPENPTEIPRSMREFSMLTPDEQKALLLNESVDGATSPEVLLQDVADYNKQWIIRMNEDGIASLPAEETYGHFLNDDGTLMPGVRQVPPWVVHAYLKDPRLPAKSTAVGAEVGDIGNALARIALITTNPGYVPQNIGGNLIFLLSTAGPSLFPAIGRYSELLVRKDKRSRLLFSMARGEMGTGHFASQSMREQIVTQGEKALKGEGKSRYVNPRNLPEFNQFLSEKLGPVADDPFRMTAWFEEAHRRGYKSIEQQIDLLTGKHKPGSKKEIDRAQIQADATARLVDFDRLAEWERATLARWLFVWPWIRGATAWPFWYAKNYPERAAAVGAVAQNYMEQSGSNDLKLPPYLDTLVRIPGTDKLANFNSVSPTSTLYEGAKTLHSMLSAKPNPTEVAAGMLSPQYQIGIEAATRRGTFGQTMSWGDIKKDAMQNLIPFYTLGTQVEDPGSISDIYAHKDRKEILMSKALRFVPRKYNEAYLAALADKAEAGKDEYGTKQYKEMNAIGKAADMDGAVPTNVRKSYDFHVQLHLRKEALKEAISNQKDFQRTEVGQAKLTKRQEFGVLLSVIEDVYPEFTGGQPMPSAKEIASEMTDEQIDAGMRRLEAQFSEPRFRWRAGGKALKVDLGSD